MKIYVVTPYFATEEAWLRQGHASVRAQTVPAHHILVCNGAPPAQIDAFEGRHIIPRRNYRDDGNTPRLIDCYNATAHGADAIAFLDGDNWFQPDHLESLLRFAADTQFDACCSARALYRTRGSFMATCPTVNARPHIDKSCLLMMNSAFEHLVAWVLHSQAAAAKVDQHI